MSSDEKASKNPFEVLELDLECDNRDVRAAFAEKIREARTSGDTDQIRAVQAAFEALRDEDHRRQLVGVVKNDAKVRELSTKAEKELEDGNVEGALHHYREMLQIVPDLEVALGRVTDLEAMLGRFEAAEAVARKLVEVAPATGKYRILFARVLMARAEQSEDRTSRDTNLKQAMAAIEKAKELGADSEDTILLDSQILYGLGRKQEARSLLEESLEGIQDFKSREITLLLALLRFDAVENKATGFRKSMHRLAAHLPESEERRGSIARELCALAQDLMEPHPQEALCALELADQCCPQHPAVMELMAIAKFQIDKRHRQKRAGHATRRRRRVAISSAPPPPPRPRKTHSGGGWAKWVAIVLAVKVSVVAIRAIHKATTKSPSAGPNPTSYSKDRAERRLRSYWEATTRNRSLPDGRFPEAGSRRTVPGGLGNDPGAQHRALRVEDLYRAARRPSTGAGATTGPSPTSPRTRRSTSPYPQGVRSPPFGGSRRSSPYSRGGTRP